MISMSDSHPAKPPTEHTLLATTDPMVWAQEFCRIFSGHIIMPYERPDTDAGIVDEGTMVGWFANAMQTALNNQQVEDEDTEDYLEEKFLEGFVEGRTEDDR
jgi:hypothetical protein